MTMIKKDIWQKQWDWQEQTGQYLRRENCERTGFLVCTDGFYRKNTEAEIGRILGGLLKTCIGKRKRGWPGQQLLSQQGTGRCGQQLERRLELLGKNGAMRGSRDDMAAIGILVE